MTINRGTEEKKGLCIWIVPPGEGRVRRMRLSMITSCVVCLLLGAICGAVTYVVGDYARVQFSRLKNDLWLQMVSRERDRLLNSNKQLAEDLEKIRAAHAHTLAFEKEAREQLDIIASVIKSSSPVALSLDKKRTEAGKLLADSSKTVEGTTVEKRVAKDGVIKPGGVGGKERDCGVGSIEECLRMPEGEQARARFSFDEKFLKRSALTEQQGNLLDKLSQFSSVLTTLPIAVPSRGEKTSGFGFRFSPFHAGIKLHEGVDYSAPIGTPVYVTAEGVVSTVEYNDTYGYYIDIKHGEKLVTRYAHLSKTYVRKDQKLKRGALIGSVGSTGRSTGPHLHYEIRVDGIAKNPETFLALGVKLAHAVLR